KSITMLRPPRPETSAVAPLGLTTALPRFTSEIHTDSPCGRGALGSAAVTSQTVTRSLSTIGVAPVAERSADAFALHKATDTTAAASANLRAPCRINVTMALQPALRITAWIPSFRRQ